MLEWQIVRHGTETNKCELGKIIGRTKILDRITLGWQG